MITYPAFLLNSSAAYLNMKAIGPPSAGINKAGLSHLVPVKYVKDEKVLIIDAFNFIVLLHQMLKTLNLSSKFLD